MSKWIAFTFSALLAGNVVAQGPAQPSVKPSAPVTSSADSSSCEAKAVGKNGKPLTGAAKDSFMKKCVTDSEGGADAGCEAKAVDKNGKPLSGAAKASFMKKCKQLAS